MSLRTPRLVGRLALMRGAQLAAYNACDARLKTSGGKIGDGFSLLVNFLLGIRKLFLKRSQCSVGIGKIRLNKLVKLGHGRSLRLRRKRKLAAITRFGIQKRMSSPYVPERVLSRDPVVKIVQIRSRLNLPRAAAPVDEVVAHATQPFGRFGVTHDRAALTSNPCRRIGQQGA
jgi:hypothetical protein